MDRPGPSGISPSTTPGRKRPREDKTTESPKTKRVQKAPSKRRRTTPVTRRQPLRRAITERAAESPAVNIPRVDRTLEEIFNRMEPDRLKQAVKEKIELALSKNQTLSPAVCRLNECFGKYSTGNCDSITLFEYVERQKLLEDSSLFQLMPLEVAIQRAEVNPDVLDKFLLAWWRSGRGFQKFYSAAKGHLSALKVTEEESWHPTDVLHASSSLKRKLEQLDEDELSKLYSGHLSKKINETGRLLLCAHVQDRALELYFLGKLGTGARLNDVLATLRKAKAPARICRSDKWVVVEVFHWLTSRVNRDSDIYSRLLDELPLSELSRSVPTDPNHEFLLACAIRNWVRKNSALSNIIQHFSSKSIMMPGWADTWESSCFARLIVNHFSIKDFFPTSLDVVSADYKSTAIKTRRDQLGFELLVRACAQEPEAIKSYIQCRLFVNEQHRRDNPALEGSHKIDCEQIAWNFNKQGIPCPLNNGGRWIGEFVGSYVS